MRNSFTQRRNERRDTLAAATARNVPAYSRGATYIVRYSSSWYLDFYRPFSLRRVLLLA
jgi:hypothetical protein